MDQKYELDGLILNTNSPYYDQKIFKWKPYEKLSIDLYCVELKRQHFSASFSEENIYKRPIGLFTHISKG